VGATSKQKSKEKKRMLPSKYMLILATTIQMHKNHKFENQRLDKYGKQTKISSVNGVHVEINYHYIYFLWEETSSTKKIL